MKTPNYMSDIPQVEFDHLVGIIRKNHPDADLDMLKLAYEFAESAHRDQTRKSGEPYIIHPLMTAQKLAEMKLDMTTIVAGILHDVPEDTDFTLEDVKKNFGKEVFRLVEGITKLGTLKYRGIERYAENLRKMFIAMSDDIRVILVKFADRLHNLKTLDALPPDKQMRIAKESLEIYAPIADRLGIHNIKGEIEDLAFQYIYPKEYDWIMKILPKEYKHKEKHLERARKVLGKKLKEGNILSEIMAISGRTKHIYSLYKKLLRPGIDRDLSKVYDLIAMRIIVPTIGDCYTAMGIIHNTYKPMPGRVKDYIAQPKPNGYQSIHTTVFTNDDDIIEIQIRTEEMHQSAEFGIAAHWHYKERGSKAIDDKKLKWVKELAEWQKQIKDNEEFLNDVKLDIFHNRIFVFTPQGDVFDLPEDSTPIDFAYYVHTSLGNHYTGARVNEHMVNYSHKLKSGDIVEIITDKNRKSPSTDWLDIVKTSMAKSKIKATLNKLNK